MSIQLVRAEIRRFLASTNAEVLCIRGDWGVGKTFTWKKFFQEAANSGAIGLNHYSYVSLFGLNDIKDIKQSLFRERQNVQNLDEDLSDSFARSFGNLMRDAKRHMPSVFQLIGERGKAAASIANDLAYQSIKNQIICIDDLERTSNSISVKDVLGLCSFLKEERKCKVVLLLNEEQLSDKDRSDYNAQFEKVVDASLSFVPTSSEAIEIGLSNDHETYSYLEQYTASTGVKNIRIIKKIERMVHQIVDELNDVLDSTWKRQISQTIVLASIILYSSDADCTLDELRNHNGLLASLREGESNSELLELIDRADFGSTDEVDLLLIDAVEHGYADYKKLREQIATLSAQRKMYDRDDEFSKAWDLYHQSLNNSDEQIVDALARAVHESPESVSLMNLNATAILMRDLDFDDRADAMIEGYFEAIDIDRDRMRDDVFLWREGPIDAKIQGKFDALEAAWTDDRDPVDVFLHMVDSQGWGREDIQLMGAQSANDLEAMFDRLEGEHLTQCLRWASRFVGTQDPELVSFGAKLTEAFERLAARSTSNERKLRLLGCLPPASTNDGP